MTLEQHEPAISILGAFDRFNYGDVLFAKVSEYLCAKAWPEVTPTFYALRAADLTSEGGVVCAPLRDLYRRKIPAEARHLIVVSGGEVLAPTWTQMAEHHVPEWFSRQILQRVHYRTGYAAWDPMWRRYYGCPNLQPWTIDPQSFAAPERTDILYNAVGGTTFKELSPAQKAWQVQALERAAWLCTRDQITADGLAARGLPAPQVLPDSAVIMARLLSETQKAASRARIVQQAGLGDGPYICVQSAEGWVRGHEQELANQLREVHARTGLNVMSFAIGRASGHDDQVTGQRLDALLGSESWFGVAPLDLSVNDIMSLIAGSQAYIGTSLHGFITSFAFDRPRVGLMPGVRKIVGFRDSWDVPEMPAGVEFHEVADALDKALTFDPASLTAQSKRVADVYLSGFSDMAQRLGAPNTVIS
ncbi:polysaccharide pyruvyl transferase family protein [Dinoroseobacter sp. S76]|uniref:polysaccharide pyruvyl transferase family protein n=1 Tax=Dinoroseobacter sp. S76 TaxID=3415124 RepID=UPI003C7BD94B